MNIPLIPRKVFFGNPDKTSVQISPDGSKIAYLAPRDGVLNVWVAPRGVMEAAAPVTEDKGRGIRFYLWAHTNNHILYLQDKNGDENWRVYSVDLTHNRIIDLTPFEGVQAQIQAVSQKHPNEIIVALNTEDPQWHSIYKINISSGAMSILEKNEEFLEFMIDDDYQVRYAVKMTPEGGAEVYQKSEEGWEIWESIDPEDFLTTGIVGFDKTNQKIYLKDSRGRNTSALFVMDPETKESQLIAEDSRVDIADMVVHPTEKAVQAVSFIYERKQWTVLDASIEPDLTYLRTIADGDIEITSRSLDDTYWIVLFVVDDGPARFYLYDRQKKQTTFLFTNRKDLEGYPLSKMYPFVFKSRDNLDLIAYYTLPPGSDSDEDGVPDHKLPLVLLPHGGPWARDYWGFNPYHQWLANRGYAALSVNFRSSTGFGKAFTNAGDMEWGGKIIEDQVDAVNWAVAKGIANAEKIAIMGGSFGGYSTLAGLTFYPELYACGVDIVGPSNLKTLLDSIPPYWKPMLNLLTRKVGNPETEEGRAILEMHSPLTHVEKIRRPLLIGQGANDPRVKQAESDQIVKAMQEKNIPVTYIVYPDEGHGFARPENRLSFFAVAEGFLAQHLGGRFEPMGEDHLNSSIQIVCGEEGVAGFS